MEGASRLRMGTYKQGSCRLSNKMRMGKGSKTKTIKIPITTITTVISSTSFSISTPPGLNCFSPLSAFSHFFFSSQSCSPSPSSPFTKPHPTLTPKSNANSLNPLITFARALSTGSVYKTYYLTSLN